MSNQIVVGSDHNRGQLISTSMQMMLWAVDKFDEVVGKMEDPTRLRAIEHRGEEVWELGSKLRSTDGEVMVSTRSRFETGVVSVMGVALQWKEVVVADLDLGVKENRGGR